jgi:NAD(P)-dependent dehydrogenase (short-subunit alcohol dehydrogenase family)
MGKIAIITGGSSGMGAAAAIALAERGVHSIVTFHNNEKGAVETVAEVEKRGAKAIALRLDLGRSDSFAAFRADVASALEKHWRAGALDYLVNNAGFGKMAPFEETMEDLYDEFARVILKGPYFLTQKLLPLLKDGGAIVNVASNSAMTTGLTPGYSAYAAMKGGLIVLTRCMAKELSARGIRVNAVSPGPTRTGMIPDDVLERYAEVITSLVEQTAFNRLGESNDIGSVIAALLSDDCRWVTGQNIEASGGYRL